MKRTRRGQGTVYEENDPKRATRYRGEKWVALPDGQHKRVSARGITIDEVLAKLERTARRLEASHPDSERLTVTAFIERWLDHKRPQVQPSTIYTYEQVLRQHLTRSLGKARLNRVTTSALQAVVDRVSASAGPAAADKLRRYAHQAFNQAVRWGLLARNPVVGVAKVRRPPARKEAWSLEQARAFLDAARRSPYYPLFYAAITTGLRQGELLALRWGDVRADHVLVRRTYSQRAPGKVQAPKTAASNRRVPITADTLAVLGRRGADASLVFPSRNGGMVNHGNLVRAFHEYRERAELPPATFHDLRRTYATMLAMDGHHPSVIQRLLGHQTPDLALRVYTVVSDDRAALATVSLGGGQSGGYEDGQPSPEADEGESLIARPGRGRVVN